MSISNMTEHNDPWGVPRDGQFSTIIPRGELLFVDRPEKIKEAADSLNAETLANPEQAEVSFPSVVTRRTGEIAVVDTVEVTKFL